MSVAGRCTMRRGFADNELLFPTLLVTFSIVLCLPVLQAIRTSRLSLAMGITIIAAVCLVFLAPWVCSGIAGRRRLRKLLDHDKEPRDDVGGRNG
jgi:hypothetical protein